MSAIPTYSANYFTILILSVLFLASGCDDREVPRTQSGEPIPFDHMISQPGGQPSIRANATQGVRNAAAPDQAIRSIKVSVKLSPALTGKAVQDDTVFIFARAAQGPKMPLAIVRKQVKDLPITVTLDDTMAMVPDMKMSSFPQLVIGARVSKSGDAISKPGDLEGYAALKVGSSRPVEVQIDTVVGGKAPSMPASRPADTAHSTEFKHAVSGTKLLLNIPADVKAKWKTVELSLSGKDIQPHKVKVSIGGELKIDQTNLLVRVVAYVPAFQSGDGAVTSASNNTENPAVLVQFVDKGKVQAEGWVFQKYPDFNTYQSERLNLQLLSASDTGG